MKLRFLRKIKFFLVIIFVIVVLSVAAKQIYPFGVKKYQTVSLGMTAEEIPGTKTVWAPPYDVIPEDSNFFVYSLGDEAMCIQSDCGLGGVFIECLGGWISGDKGVGDISDYGLREAGIDINKKKIIIISDKDGKIVGIYPGASIRNLPYIMRRHRDLVSSEAFEWCSNSIPRWWK